MSNVYYQQYNMPYGQRSRRTARPRQFNNKQKSVILQAAPQDVAQTAYARDLEAARSFDIEDDAVFCPGLLTEDDFYTNQGVMSDRSSMSSSSPEASPAPGPSQLSQSGFLLPPAMNDYSSRPQKLHQPLAQRTRNAIPIVDPGSAYRNASPPSFQQQYGRRW